MSNKIASSPSDSSPPLPSEAPRPPGHVTPPETSLAGHGEAARIHDRTDRTAAIAGGIESLAGPAMRDCSGHVAAAIGSQKRLAAELDRLTEALDVMLEEVPILSPDTKRRTEKLTDLHTRLLALSSNLHVIQDRVRGMNITLSERETATGGETSVPLSTQTTTSSLSNWALRRSPYYASREREEREKRERTSSVEKSDENTVVEILTPEAISALIKEIGPVISY